MWLTILERAQTLQRVWRRLSDQTRHGRRPCQPWQMDQLGNVAAALNRARDHQTAVLSLTPKSAEAAFDRGQQMVRRLGQQACIGTTGNKGKAFVQQLARKSRIKNQCADWNAPRD